MLAWIEFSNRALWQGTYVALDVPGYKSVSKFANLRAKFPAGFDGTQKVQASL